MHSSEEIAARALELAGVSLEAAEAELADMAGDDPELLRKAAGRPADLARLRSGFH